MKLILRLKIFIDSTPIFKPFTLFIIILIMNIIRCKALELSDSLKTKDKLYYTSYFQYGKVLATNPYLKMALSADDKSIQYTALSFQVMKQTTGEEYWERNYGFPQYGIGVYSANFFENKDFGSPIAIYGVFKAPFKRWEKFCFNYESGFGLTFNWKSFNPVKNDYNPSLGAKESVFIDLGINLNYEFGRHFDLGIGYSFTHFSNGAIKSPNLGLNTFSPKFILAYNVKRFKPLPVRRSIKAFIKYTTIDFSIFGGFKNVIYKGNDVDTITKYRGVYYPVFGFNTVLNQQINPKSKIGFGASLGYDGSNNSTIYVDNGELEPEGGFHADRFNLSIFPSYELVINKLSVIVQSGFYILRKQTVTKKPMTYQRLGLHYQLSEKLFAGIVLHAYNYHISDFIEWTLGYRLSLTKGQISF